MGEGVVRKRVGEADRFGVWGLILVSSPVTV